MINTALYPQFSFNVKTQDLKSRARCGFISTPHGIIETPNFIFCATKGTMKALRIDMVKQTGAQIILSNTYHLMLSPGADLVKKMGGLHTFMNWTGPLFTDSGGFQIFSLGHGSIASEIKGNRMQKSNHSLLKINEQGAIFKSYLDGRQHLLTPEKSIDVQMKLGADLIVVLDECTPFHVDKSYTEHSMRMSHRWALRSLEEFKKRTNETQALYGIIQGGVYEDLRKESTDFVNAHCFFGHAIGGSLGASKQQMFDVMSMTAPSLRRDRPIHLLGIGGISDIFEGVSLGIDTFDCVHPTRLARHGGALVQPHLLPEDKKTSLREHLNLRNSCYTEDPSPIDPLCPCYTCQNLSRAYLHYLLKSKELVALELLTLHNITFMVRLMKDIREGIEQKTLSSLRKKWCS